MSQNIDSHAPEKWGMLPVILLLIGCAFLLLAGLQVRYDQQSSENLRRVSGRVDRLYTEKRGGPESSRPDEVKMAAYSFDAEKQTHQSTAVLTEKEWSSLKVGGALPVAYLSNDPRFSTVDRPPLWGGSGWIAGIVALMGLGALLLSLKLFLMCPRSAFAQTTLDRVSPSAKIY